MIKSRNNFLEDIYDVLKKLLNNDYAIVADDYYIRRGDKKNEIVICKTKEE